MIAKPRRWRFWLLCISGPLLVFAVVVVVWVASVSGDLRRAQAEADARDPNWRLENLENTRETPPPDQNAAARITDIARLIPGQPPALSVSELLRQLPPPALLDQSQVSALGKFLEAAGSQTLADARSLIETPHGRHAITWAPDAFSTALKCQENREVANLLCCDALVRAQAGDLTGAIVACHAAFHAGCSLGDEPTAISQLVRAALQWFAVQTVERVLAQGEPPADVLAALQSRLEAEEPAPLFLYAVRGERASGNMLFDNLRNGSVLPATMIKMRAGILGGVGDPDVIGPMTYVPGFLTTQHAAYIRYFNGMAEIAQRPPQEWESLLAQLTANLPKSAILVRLLAPSMNKIPQAYIRNHAVLRSAIVALAVERFRQQYGRWPEAPGELVSAKLLAAVPTDPYDNQPIRFVRTVDGLIVYCVGLDRADDGGKLDRQFGATKPGTDLGFQLWDVPARRRPVLPPTPTASGDVGGLGP
jgi:hypothetical protein